MQKRSLKNIQEYIPEKRQNEVVVNYLNPVLEHIVPVDPNEINRNITLQTQKSIH